MSKKAVELVKPKEAPLTPKAKAFSKIDTYERSWAKLLPKGSRASWFSAECKVAITNNPGLVSCTDSSLFSAFTTCAELGLSPSGRLGSAYVIPYRTRVKDETSGKWVDAHVAQLVVGYRGLVDLASRGGDVLAIWADVVYEGEEFEHVAGLNPDLRHRHDRSTADKQDPGNLRACYAVAKMKNGVATFVVLYQPDVDRARQSNRASDGEKSPWKTHTAEMWKKTAVRRLMKTLPLNPERLALLTKAGEVDSDRTDEAGVEDAVWEEMHGATANERLADRMGVGSSEPEDPAYVAAQEAAASRQPGEDG